MTPLTRPRLIIADDHLNVAHSLRALLEPDYDVVDVVADGTAVVAAVAKHHPDLLLLDLWLPGRNGLDLLTDLARERPELRVVVLTMHADIVVAVEAMNRGARGYLLKDSGYDELKDALGVVLGGTPYLSPRISGTVSTTIFRERAPH
ncbi:MAG TPA: response regulator transcription factor [Gemmatimonadales bacterium]|nr:response regulator transcription factor [Gemmatimonadales bacterium]